MKMDRKPNRDRKVEDTSQISESQGSLPEQVQKPSVGTAKEPELSDRPYIRHKFQALSDLINVFPKLLLLLFSMFFALVIYTELKKDAVLLEPFEAPQDLQKNGYTGRAIANKLLDQITYIKSSAATKMERREFIPMWAQTLPAISLPGASISLRSITGYIREFFGWQTIRIVGEVVRRDDKIYLTIRSVGKPPKTIRGRIEELDDILHEAAKHIYKHAQPYILASYLSDVDRDGCLKVIRHTLEYDPPDDDPWALTLWGVLFQQKKAFKEAIVKYQAAINHTLKGNRESREGAKVKSLAYHNWGNALYEQKQYAIACSKYQKAIEHDSENIDAYINWGNVLAAQKKYQEAEDKYKKASMLDPRNAAVYVNWGNMLNEQKDFVRANEMYKTAIDIDPKIARTYFLLRGGIATPQVKITSETG